MGYAAWSLRSFQREEPSKAARYARCISYAADVAHPIGVAMRLIIEARLEAGETSETKATTVAVVERKDRSVADLGLTLAVDRIKSVTARTSKHRAEAPLR